jgi:carbamoyl-phosphate synthase large subunit
MRWGSTPAITVAPAQTLTDKEYQIMRNASMAVLREIGVETGGSNVQFSVNPKTGRLIVIEMNPRVSRSSALALKQPASRLPWPRNWRWVTPSTS